MKFVDLFSGMGGFRLGIENSVNECVFSADFDKFACETYEKNFKQYPLIDITKLDSKQIPNHDLLVAGFPCQPFSIAGFRKGFNDIRGTLFFEILRILQDKNPNILLLENVKGLINHDKGKTFETMLNYLASSINGVPNRSKFKENLGYHVFWKILNSNQFGLPQNRERVFIIGFREKINNFEFPKIVKKESSLISVLDKKPDIKRISKNSQNYIKHYLKNHKNYLEIKDLEYLVAYEIRKSRVNFRFDNLSPCLTTKMGTGGNNVPYLVNQNRFFTLKECLKIQGFPENFKLTNSYSHALRQIGNSVSVPVVERIEKQLQNYV